MNENGFRFSWVIVLFALFCGCATGKTRPVRVVQNSKKGFLDLPSPGRPSSLRTQLRKNVGKDVAATLVTPRHSKQGGKGSPAVPSHPDDFSWPLIETSVTSSFGKRGREYHEGLDLRAASGTPVFAANSGKVLYADSKIHGYGKLVVIRHRGKLATIYAHNSKIVVRRGEYVRRGQLISYSGNSGHSHGPHLHFEIRQGLQALNPLAYLPTLEKKLGYAAPVPGSRSRLTATN